VRNIHKAGKRKKKEEITMGRTIGRKTEIDKQTDKQTTIKTLKCRYIHVKKKLYLLPKTFTKAVPMQLKTLHI
jgi:hypothetical protein